MTHEVGAKDAASQVKGEPLEHTMSDVVTKKAKGTVRVRSETCKGCSFCVDFCPTKCLAFSRDFNAKGYHYPVLATPEACTGCDLCGNYCPDFAIVGIRLKDAEKRCAAAVVQAETTA